MTFILADKKQGGTKKRKNKVSIFILKAVKGTRNSSVRIYYDESLKIFKSKNVEVFYDDKKIGLIKLCNDDSGRSAYHHKKEKVKCVSITHSKLNFDESYRHIKSYKEGKDGSLIIQLSKK